ncbi:hypothetical protein ACJX0J_039126, partial [Zea mays]
SCVNKLPKSIIMCSLALTTTSAKRHGGELTSLQQIYDFSLRQLKDLNELGGSLHLILESDTYPGWIQEKLFISEAIDDIDDG